MASNTIRIGESPYHPGPEFKFPPREFSGTKRTAHFDWFVKWKWLHYDENSDSVYCFTCLKAFKENKLKSSKRDSAFIEKGFQNWKEN